MLSQQELIDKYPILLGNFLEGRGIECQEGWHGIIDSMCEKINRVLELSQCSATIGLIKSKFGKMRVQGVVMDAPTLDQQIIRAVISQTEAVSSITCTVCGEYGWQKRGTMQPVMCQLHQDEWDSKRLNPWEV